MEATLALSRAALLALSPSLLLALVAANLFLVQGLATVLLDPGGGPVSAISEACKQLREHPALLKPQTAAEKAARKTCQSHGYL